jgi:excisionase family DNA binding protein
MGRGAVVTLKEAAARLGVMPATLRQQIANGALQATKRGRDWWVTPAQLDAYRTRSLGRPGRRPNRPKVKP